MSNIPCPSIKNDLVWGLSILRLQGRRREVGGGIPLPLLLWCFYAVNQQFRKEWTDWQTGKKKGLEFGGDLPSFSSCPGLPSKLPVQPYQLGALQQALLIRRTNKRIEKPIKEMERTMYLCLFLSVFVQKRAGLHTGPSQQIEVWEDLDVVQFLSKTFFAYEVDCIAHVSVVRIGANLQKLWWHV